NKGLKGFCEYLSLEYEDVKISEIEEAFTLILDTVNGLSVKRSCIHPMIVGMHKRIEEERERYLCSEKISLLSSEVELRFDDSKMPEGFFEFYTTCGREKITTHYTSLWPPLV